MNTLNIASVLALSLLLSAPAHALTPGKSAGLAATPQLRVKIRTLNRKPLVGPKGQSIQTMGYGLRGPRNLLRKIRSVEWTTASGKRLSWGGSPRQAFGSHVLAITGDVAKLKAKVRFRDGTMLEVQGRGTAAANKYDAEAMRRHKFKQSLRKLKGLNRRDPSPRTGQVIEMLEGLEQ